MRQSYLKNAALMTGADVLLRLAGMGLRIYLYDRMDIIPFDRIEAFYHQYPK